MELSFSILFIFLVYIYICSGVKSFINGLSYLAADNLAKLLLSLIYFLVVGYSQGGYAISHFAVFIASTFWAASFFFAAIGYVGGWKINTRQLQYVFNPIQTNLSMLIIFFIVLMALYVHFVGAVSLINPRALYATTRLGFGHIYFVIKAIALFAFTSSLFLKKHNLVKAIAFILSLVIVYLSGSKGTLLTLIYILVFYYIFSRKKHITFFQLLLLSIAGFFVLIGIFYIFSPFARHKIFSYPIYYADYVRNFAVEVDNIDKTFGGQLTWEDNFYSLMPRALFENKPKIFGTFRLTLLFYPERTLAFSGAPSFGPFGRIFADFGWSSLFVVIVSSFIKGFFIGTFERKIRTLGINLTDFLFFILLSYGYFLSVGLSSFCLLVANIVMLIAFLTFTSLDICRAKIRMIRFRSRNSWAR